MGKINLARVDERLIHGQVMLTLSQRDGVNSIFVVDDVVANDKFMKSLYKSAGSRTGQKTIIMTLDKAKYYWDEFQFKDYSAIVIAKTIDVFYALAKHGIPIEEFNLGGIAKKSEQDKQVSKTVYMDEEDAKMLREMHDELGVKNIYFQSTPSDTKVSYESGMANFK